MQCLNILILTQIVAISQGSKSRSVNLALETVLEFNNNDDIKFIDTMQNYLEKLKRIITKNKTSYRTINNKLKDNVENNEKQLKFSELLAQTISVLKSYSDETLRRFFSVLNEEFTKWKNNTSLDTADKLGFRRIVITNLKDFKNSRADDIRRKLSAISKKLDHNKRNRENSGITDFLNYFYSKESQMELSRFVNNLKLYRTKSRRSMNLSLERIIRHGIKYIMEPILKLNSNNKVDRLRKENVVHKSDSQLTELEMMKNIKEEIKKLPEILGDRNNIAQKDTKMKQILDYIQDLKRLVDNHIITVEIDTSEKNKQINDHKNSGYIQKYEKTTRLQKHSKQKPIYSTAEKVIKEKPRKKKNKKKTAKSESKSNNKKYSEKEEAEHELITDLSETKLPLYSIELESLSKSDEDISLKTTKQRRYKKFTRRLSTTKLYLHAKTPKQGRKAFKTTDGSHDGLSIEHFGSLYSTRSFIINNRKSNDNDSFTQAIINTTLTHEIKRNLTHITIAPKKDIIQGHFKEQTINNDDKDNANMRNERKNTEINNVDLRELNNIISENVKLSGNIIFETPAKAIRTTKIRGGVNNKKDLNKYTNGTTLTKQQLSTSEMKPTVVLRSQDFIKTDLATNKASTQLKVVTKPNTSETTTKKDGKKPHTIKTDDLENEIENIMYKFNTSTITPEDLNNILKETEDDENIDNNKVQSQMKADFEKLFAPSTTKSTAAETFTDPFKDIDDGIGDILFK